MGYSPTVVDAKELILLSLHAYDSTTKVSAGWVVVRTAFDMESGLKAVAYRNNLDPTLIAVAIAGKLGGSALAARLTGMRWREALQLGALMNTRGLMELIALNIGYDMGILSQRIFTMLVIMALVTTIMTRPLMTLFGKEQRRPRA